MAKKSTEEKSNLKFEFSDEQIQAAIDRGTSKPSGSSIVEIGSYLMSMSGGEYAKFPGGRYPNMNRYSNAKKVWDIGRKAGIIQATDVIKKYLVAKHGNVVRSKDGSLTGFERGGYSFIKTSAESLPNLVRTEEAITPNESGDVF